MEDQIQENQVNQPEVEQAPVVVEKKKVKPLTIAILLIAILLIPAGVYAGIQIGKKKMAGGLLTKITPTTIPQPTSVPTQISTPTSVVIPPTNTPAETANWKTHESFGYSIKYPSKETFDVVRKNDSWEELIYYSDVSKKAENIFSLSVSRDKTSGKSIFELCESDMRCDEYGKLNSYDTAMLISDTVPPDFCFNYMLVNDRYLYILEATKCNFAIFDQILSTFKFLD